MTSSLPIYKDILNQAKALEQVSIYQSGPGWNALTTAANAIKSADEVVLIAIGASYSASIPFTYRFAGTGKRVILEDAAEFLHYTNSAYRGGSTVFMLISRSGETIEITRCLKLLKGRDQAVIGVTNEASSQLAREADVPLIIGGPSDHLVSIQTYLTTMLTLHLLAEVIIEDLDSSELLGDGQELVKRERENVSYYQSKSLEWKSHMREYRAIYLMARGPSLASAHQGAILLHEMSRFPGIACSAGQFRHGPWEVIDERIRCFVFAPSDAAYALNLALAEDLVGMGGDVTLISDKQVEGPLQGIRVWEIPHINPTLTPFFEIIPIQFFIYEFACWSDLTPGNFRASAPITLSETGSLLTTQ